MYWTTAEEDRRGNQCMWRGGHIAILEGSYVCYALVDISVREQCFNSLKATEEKSIFY